MSRMPTEEHDAIQHSLREQHPDWSAEQVNETTYRILVSRGWRPSQRHPGGESVRQSRQPQGIVKGLDTAGRHYHRPLVAPPPLSATEQARRAANDARLAAVRSAARAEKAATRRAAKSSVPPTARVPRAAETSASTTARVPQVNGPNRQAQKAAEEAYQRQFIADMEAAGRRFPTRRKAVKPYGQT